ncbi:hypothetical protein GIB67_038489 [Kingdonia uniflora]|uniref:Disease resistance R13L4/SHOC-2-like LRR domain-containing protein n=1 Tax=Kingdonia uniflora TaxID=39325 RepID=A0A7J7NPV3_9MAGN|nr:hypothetical protein GIB67_038489 [Kingdonia uniflora]
MGIKIFFSNTKGKGHEVVVVLCFLCSVLSVLCGEVETELAPMKKTERDALFYGIQGFVGKWWNGSELYPDPCGWTPIEGVSCDNYDGFWYVTVLNIGLIHENSLECISNAEFPQHLFELKHLQTLSFTNCFQYPHHLISIPTDKWESLAGSLLSLEFRSNPSLRGHVPLSFGSLTKLQSLVLVENGLTGEIPYNFGNFVGLKRLVLTDSGFTGRIPDSLGELTKLLILDFSRNSLNGQLPFTFGGLTSLLKLDLSNNLLEGHIPSELRKLKNLTLLDIRNNKFKGGLSQPLQEMVSLEEMALSNNPIGGNIMSFHWENLQNLVSLDLSNMGLNGEIPESLTKLKKLRFLGLRNNNLSGEISPKLATDLPCLSALYFNGNNLIGELKFSGWFYKKMGRRFGAWGNQNLCFPVELMATGHVPFGVKACQGENEVILMDSKTRTNNNKLVGENINYNSSFFVSLGTSTCGGVGGTLWGSLVKEIVITLLLLNVIL